MRSAASLQMSWNHIFGSLPSALRTRSSFAIACLAMLFPAQCSAFQKRVLPKQVARGGNLLHAQNPRSPAVPQERTGMTTAGVFTASSQFVGCQAGTIRRPASSAGGRSAARHLSLRSVGFPVKTYETGTKYHVPADEANVVMTETARQCHTAGAYWCVIDLRHLAS